MLEIELPDGGTPTWDDAVILNIGVGVVPELRVRAFMGDRDDEWLPAVHLNLSFHFSDARYRATFVGLEAPDVSSVDLREIRVSELIRLGSAAGIFVKRSADAPPTSLREDFGDAGEPNWTSPASAAKIRAAGPADWVLRAIALSYQIARLSSDPPAKAVERQFGLAPRTAARWIAKAKAAGYLTRPAEPGGEELAEMMDHLRERIANGESLIHEVTLEDLEREDDRNG